jgi:hypothetical protein
VTNNRSAHLSRPDLRYADDDGAKYFEVFGMVAPESNIVLLTAFDRDTQKLFPGLVGKERPPIKVAVLAAAAELAEKIKIARERGPVDFYFVFAGHGDVENGKGFLELTDAPFTSDDLESLLGSIPATRKHVILDSCNSFFVINSRKPGGRHFVTSEEAAKSLSERLPNVGVFLSTSAEAEVYEWSELQSGVFSHAVRSGLAGAADVDGDGHVSYDELRAFVDIASRNVKNPNYRPKVFARGPGGRGADALIDLHAARAKHVRIDGLRRRLTVVDANELRWVDLHKEPGKELTLYLPESVAANATIDEADTAKGAIVRRYGLGTTGARQDDALASLPSSAPSLDARGPGEMFAALFTEPFGAKAFERYQKEHAKDEPEIFGVSSDDKSRMHDLLELAADRERTERYATGLSLGGLGAVVLGAGTWLIRQSSTSGEKAASAVLLVYGGALSGIGLVRVLVPSDEEEIFQHYAAGMERSENAAQVAADAEKRLFDLARRYHTTRLWIRGLGIGMGVLSVGGATAGIVAAKDKNGRFASVLLGGVGLAVSELTAGISFMKFPTEETAEIWAKDPSLQRMRRPPTKLEIHPEIGLGIIGVGGTF